MNAITLPGFLRYTLFNAPWALICTLSFGLSNYLILLLLSLHYGLAEAGKFRLFLSIIELLGLFSLLDTGKILIKNVVMGKRGVARPLLLHRAKWALVGALIGCIVAFVLQQKGNDIWIAILIGALLLPVSTSGDLYDSLNQAKRLFRNNAFCALAKFGSLTLMALVMGYLGVGVLYFMMAYFVVVAAFHALFITRHQEIHEPAGPEASELKKQSIQLSAAGIFPMLLEQADKLLISYFFGLEALGLYTIGVSTGRLFLHFIRPLLTIYFPYLVNNRLSPQLLLAAGTALTLAGGLAIWPLKYYFSAVLGAKFAGAYAIAAVPLAGLGIYFVGVISYYSSIYHRSSDIRIPTITNIITATLVMTYLLLVVTLADKNTALILCAVSYPLRELSNLIVISLLTRRFGAHAQAGSIL